MARKNEDLHFFGFILIIAFAVLALVLTQNNNCTPAQGPWIPEFADPHVKLAELSNPQYTGEIFREATSFQPLLKEPGTQVHMGFWSGAGNHGSLVRLLDGINNYKPGKGETAQKAVWDEGPESSLQYPAYTEMNARELWYARSSPGKDGKVMLYGKEYADPYNISFAEADAIWGEYSERYADMAVLFKQATGKKVQVWCFVQGAKPNRVFYTYEYPELVKLEKEGIIEVHFAKNPDADWKRPQDWIRGTENATPGS